MDPRAVRPAPLQPGLFAAEGRGDTAAIGAGKERAANCAIAVALQGAAAAVAAAESRAPNAKPKPNPNGSSGCSQQCSAANGHKDEGAVEAEGGGDIHQHEVAHRSPSVKASAIRRTHGCFHRRILRWSIVCALEKAPALQPALGHTQTTSAST